MTMRPFTDVRGGLNHIVDAQIGRAFPVVHKVYQHLDAIEYIAQVYEAGRSRDIVLRTNHTKEWIEWQYKGEATWTILFKFSDLLGADIADVVAAEQALAAELEALREHIIQLHGVAEDARDQAQAAELGSVDAKNAAEAAQASASISAQKASASAIAAAQSAQDTHDVKAATEVIVATVANHHDAAALSAQQAADSADSANSAKDTAVSARAEAQSFASAASTSFTEAKAAQQAAESSAQAARQSETVALGAAEGAATSASAANASAQTAAAYQVAAEAAATAGAQHLADVEAQVVSVETLKQETVDAQQASLAAKAGAEEAAVNATTFAENAGVSAAESATSANEAEASANSAELSAQSAAAHKAEAENQAVAAATSAQKAADKATAAEASALAAAAFATTATEKLGEVSTLHDAAVTASTTATEAAGTTTTRLAQVTALHSATESFAQAAQASAAQADIAATAADASASVALQLRNETQGFHDAASLMVVDAAQVSADRATVQTLAQEAQLAANQAESNALAASDSANTAVSSASAAANSATNAQTNADVVRGQVTAITGRLDEADSIVTTVTTLRDETLSYKLAAQDSTTNAQAVAADRAAVADMLVDVQANATAVSDAVSDATSAASAAQLAASSAEDSSNTAAQNLAAAQAAQLAAESAATLATDANAGALAALTNHTAAADPHTQYLTKAESTDALAAKVDKVVGKQLSTEDFTTSDRNKLNTIQEGAEVNPIPVINLASTDDTLPLAASQGKVLKGFIDQINQLLQSDDTTLNDLQEIVDFVKLNRAELNALGIDNIAGLRTALDGKQPVSSILTGTTASFTSALKDKLDAIATQATKNEADAFLLDRANHTGTQPVNTITGLTKASVGLSNVDNTADSAKPVSTAQQTALNLKANLASPALTGTPTAPTAASTTNTTQLATTAFVQAVNAADTGSAATAVKLKTARTLSIGSTGKSFDGSANVSWSLAEIGAEQTLAAGTTAQYYRGDKTWQTLNKAAVGLGSVDNTSDANKPVSTDTQNALNNKVDKVAGKQLSTEDYTSAEKTKLSGIAAGANAYTHPANHPASIITQDANNRFVTDAEKAAWNAKGVGDVTLTGVQTLTNKTLTGYTETVYNLTGTAIAVANGTIQTKTLSANTTFTESLADGQSVILGITAGVYSVTWPSVTWSKVGGSGTAPTLTSTGVNWIILWKVDGVVRGSFMGTA